MTLSTLLTKNNQIYVSFLSTHSYKIYLFFQTISSSFVLFFHFIPFHHTHLLLIYLLFDFAMNIVIIIVFIVPKCFVFHRLLCSDFPLQTTQEQNHANTMQTRAHFSSQSQEFAYINKRLIYGLTCRFLFYYCFYSIRASTPQFVPRSCCMNV